MSRYMKLSEILEITTLSKSTVYRLEEMGKFPNRIRISTGRVAWRSNEIDAWMAERPDAKPDDMTGDYSS